MPAAIGQPLSSGVVYRYSDPGDSKGNSLVMQIVCSPEATAPEASLVRQDKFRYTITIKTALGCPTLAQKNHEVFALLPFYKHGAIISVDPLTQTTHGEVISDTSDMPRFLSVTGDELLVSTPTRILAFKRSWWSYVGARVVTTDVDNTMAEMSSAGGTVFYFLASSGKLVARSVLDGHLISSISLGVSTLRGDAVDGTHFMYVTGTEQVIRVVGTDATWDQYAVAASCKRPYGMSYSPFSDVAILWCTRSASDTRATILVGNPRALNRGQLLSLPNGTVQVSASAYSHTGDIYVAEANVGLLKSSAGSRSVFSACSTAEKTLSDIVCTEPVLPDGPAVSSSSNPPLPDGLRIDVSSGRNSVVVIIKGHGDMAAFRADVGNGGQGCSLTHNDGRLTASLTLNKIVECTGGNPNATRIPMRVRLLSAFGCELYKSWTVNVVVADVVPDAGIVVDGSDSSIDVTVNLTTRLTLFTTAMFDKPVSGIVTVNPGDILYVQQAGEGCSVGLAPTRVQVVWGARSRISVAVMGVESIRCGCRFSVVFPFPEGSWATGQEVRLVVSSEVVRSARSIIEVDPVSIAVRVGSHDVDSPSGTVAPLAALILVILAVW
eukprot:m51a1_g8414 hypothetical protein (607) ;mRNA; r:282681-284501